MNVEVDNVSEADEELAGAIVARAADPANPAADLGTRGKPVKLTAVVDPVVAATGHYTLTIGSGIALFNGTTQLLPDPATGSLTKTYPGTATLPTQLKAIGTAVNENAAFIQLDFVQNGETLYTDRTVVQVMHTTPRFLGVMGYGSPLNLLPAPILGGGNNLYVTLPKNYSGAGSTPPDCFILIPIETACTEDGVNSGPIPEPEITIDSGALHADKFKNLNQIEQNSAYAAISQLDYALRAKLNANGFWAIKYTQSGTGTFTIKGRARVKTLVPGGTAISVSMAEQEEEWTLNVISVDLDPDRDRNILTQDPDRMNKDNPNLPGMLVLANTLDRTANNVPDFADGFNMHGNAGVNKSGEFARITLEVEGLTDLSSAKIRITYSASPPYIVSVSGNPPEYTPGSTGHLRLWQADGPADRRTASVSAPSAPGHYIPPGVHDLRKVIPVGNFVTLYAEGINRTDPANTRITVELDPLGTGNFIAMDAMRCSVVTLDLDFRDITGADWASGAGVPRIPAASEANGAACDRLIGAYDGGALLLARVLASPLLYNAAVQPNIDLGYIKSNNFNALPDREGFLNDLTTAEHSFVGALGLQRTGEQLPDGRWVLKAQKYRPPFEMDIFDPNNKQNERQMPLALRVSGAVTTTYGSRPNMITLVRAPLVLVHGINSSYTSGYIESKWVEKFENDFGFKCWGADHSEYGGLHGNGDVHTSYVCVPGAINSAKNALRNGGAYPTRRMAIQKCDVVAHSYGGILSRWYTEQSGEYSTRRDVRKLITMGTPHRGAPITNIMCAAYKREVIHSTKTTAVGYSTLGVLLESGNQGNWPLDILRWHTGGSHPDPYGDDRIVPSIQVLSFSSAVLTKLNTSPFHNEIAYASIVGYDETLVGPWVNLHETLEPRYSSSSSYFPWLPMLDGADGQSDGVVPRWSQILPEKRRFVDTHHTGYTTNDTVREQVRAWLNDQDLPNGAYHRNAFNAYTNTITDRISRLNAYVGSKLDNTTKISSGADIREEAIVRMTDVTPSHPETDLTYDTLNNRHVLGSRGGLVTFHCTGMVRYGNVGWIAGRSISPDGVEGGDLQANFPITIMDSNDVPVAGSPFVRVNGELIPFKGKIDRIGRTYDGRMIGPHGRTLAPASALLAKNYQIMYRLGGPVSIVSPPATIRFSDLYYLPSPETDNLLIPELPSKRYFTVRGGIPCANAPGVIQNIHVKLKHNSAFFSENPTLVDATIDTVVPQNPNAFPDVMIPYENQTLYLYKDGNGFVAGSNGNSGEDSAKVYQEISVPGWGVSKSGDITVYVEP